MPPPRFTRWRIRGATFLVVGLAFLPSGARGGLYGFAGGNLTGASRIGGDAEDGTEAKAGFYAGVGLSRTVRPGFDVAIHAAYEMRRVQREQEGDWYEADVGSLVHERRSHLVGIDYVAMGATLRWRPSARWFVGLGPEVALPIAGEDQITVTTNEWERERSIQVQDQVANPDLALWFETGMEVRIRSVLCGPHISVGLGVREIGGNDGRIGETETGLGNAKYRMLRFSLVLGQR